MRPLFVTLPIVVLAAGAGFFFHPWLASPRAQLAVASASPAVAVDAPLPRMEITPSSTPPTAAKLPEAPEPTPRVGASAPSTPEPPARRPSEGEMKDHLQATFVGQPSDPSWSRRLRSSLEDGLRGRASARASSLRDVDCRESLCQVKMTHESREDYDRFVGDALLSASAPLWTAASFTTIVMDDDGRVIATSYLAHEGAELPAFSD